MLSNDLGLTIYLFECLINSEISEFSGTVRAAVVGGGKNTHVLTGIGVLDRNRIDSGPGRPAIGGVLASELVTRLGQPEFAGIGGGTGACVLFDESIAVVVPLEGEPVFGRDGYDDVAGRRPASGDIVGDHEPRLGPPVGVLLAFDRCFRNHITRDVIVIERPILVIGCPDVSPGSIDRVVTATPGERGVTRRRRVDRWDITLRLEVRVRALSPTLYRE